MKHKTVINLCVSGAAMCAVALLVLLSGCSFDPPKPTMQRNVTTITVIESKDLPPHNLGRAVYAGDQCVIVLREYPRCLQHEVRHCLEGAWHGAAPNDEDCHE